jgi:hypothetical protein
MEGGDEEGSRGRGGLVVPTAECVHGKHADKPNPHALPPSLRLSLPGRSAASVRACALPLLESWSPPPSLVPSLPPSLTPPHPFPIAMCMFAMPP